MREVAEKLVRPDRARGAGDGAGLLRHIRGGLHVQADADAPDRRGARGHTVRTLRLLGAGLFVAAIPVFLIATNTRHVINAPFLYSYGFDAYDITAVTGISTAELLSAGKQIRDYFNNGEEFLDVRVMQDGVRRSLYTEREVLHMKDVKGLVRGVYAVQWLAGLYLAGYAAVGLFLGWRAFLPKLVRRLAMGGAATLGLVALVGLASLVGFDRLFLAFHLVSFSNDLWQLDPRRHYLLAMFPQGFFFDATMWIAGATIIEALLLAATPFSLRRWRSWRRRHDDETIVAQTSTA